MKRLIQMSDDQIVRQITLSSRYYRLGRGIENDIVFNSPGVSRFHAELVEDGDTYTVIDKNSSNHVFVNGEKITRRQLVSGDKVNLSRQISLLYLNDTEAEVKVNQALNRILGVINKKDFMRLKEVSSRIIAIDSLDKILNIILQEVISLVHAERGFIALADKQGKILFDTSVSHNVPPRDEETKKWGFSMSIVNRALTERQSIFVLNTEDGKEPRSDSVLELNLLSIMCAPLLFGEKILGVMYVDSHSTITEFDEVDRFFFSMLTDQASIAIENAKIYDKEKTQKVALQEEIKESEERYRQLIELSPAVIMVISDDEIKFANPAAVKVLGAKFPDDITGKKITKFITTSARIEFKKYINKINEGHFQESLSFRIKTIDNRDIDLEFTGVPFDYNGLPSTLIIANDITAKLKFEEEQLKIKKLESLALLAGGIAHDFNNIMTSVIGNISLSKMITDPRDEVFEILSDAERASLRAKELTQQLLTFSRGGTPMKKKTNISRLLRESATLTLSGSNVKSKFNINDDLFEAEVDESQIGQVITSLVQNADQAMPDGGTIDVKAENVEIQPGDTLDQLRPGKYIKIAVTDSGMGIPKENIERIFDPYFTTKQKGNGLGLAISYSIIKNHDGYIDVKSTEGQGSTFTLYIPASQMTRLLPDGKDIMQGKQRILLMDDEEIVRNVAGRMLKHIGYLAAVSSDVPQAARLYKMAIEVGEPFDLVILDLTLPEDGSDRPAATPLFEVDPQMKIIVSTDNQEDPILTKYEEMGFQGAVAKPFKLTELGKLVQKVLNE